MSFDLTWRKKNPSCCFSTSIRLKMCGSEAARPQTQKDVRTTRTNLWTTCPVGAQTRGLRKHVDGLLSVCVWPRACSSSVCTLGHCLKEEALELNSDDQESDLDRLNIICIKEEDPEDDDYLCKTAEHTGVHSVHLYDRYTPQNELFKARRYRLQGNKWNGANIVI